LRLSATAADRAGPLLTLGAISRENAPEWDGCRSVLPVFPAFSMAKRPLAHLVAGIRKEKIF
jgi:hypothetical protein